MKKLICAAFIVAVGASLGAAFIARDAALASGVLSELKFEALPAKDPKMVGAPPKYKVTKATIEHLQKLEKDGKTIAVQNDGSIKIE